MPTYHNPPPSISIPSSVEELLSLAKGGSKRESDQFKRVIPYVHSSLTIGRHLDRAVVVTLGESGRGKSKTINTLVGASLLAFAKRAEGSKTKVWVQISILLAIQYHGFQDIQRISVQSTDANTGVDVTLSFDDTPGRDDTIYDDRDWTEALIQKYAKEYYPDVPLSEIVRVPGLPAGRFRGKVYPNAILLVVSWRDIRSDDEHSPIETTMKYLERSDLIDHQHLNVIVVVTKSLSSFEDYEDFSSEDEKNTEWREDAAAKTRIIHGFRSQVFPSSSSWPVVFVENGGGRTILQEYIRLPNGDLGHQKLFDAILHLFSGGSTKMPDLVGIQALRILTGDRSVISKLQLSPAEILFKREDIIEKEKSDMVRSLSNFTYLEFDCHHQSPKVTNTANSDGYSSAAHPSAPFLPGLHPFHNLAKTRLGVGYDPIFRSFGRVPIVDLKDTDIHIDKYSCCQQVEDVHTGRGVERDCANEEQLRARIGIRSVATTGAHGTATSAATSSLASASHMFRATIRVATAKLTVPTPTLSNDICQEIKALPHWDASEGAKSDYGTFFGKHGTHVNVQAALGGVLWIRSHSSSSEKRKKLRRALEITAEVPIASQVGVTAEVSAKHTRSGNEHVFSSDREIEVFRVGGGSVASQLTSALEELANLRGGSPESLQNWVNIRTRWIVALDTDPAFCAADLETRYMWLYELNGIDRERKADLRQASEWYLYPPDASTQAGVNLKKVETELARARTGWLGKFWKRVKFWNSSTTSTTLF